MSAVDVWNVVGTWLGALGTVGATVTALSIAIRDGRERDAARRDDEAAQARTLTIEATPAGYSIVGDVVDVVITNHGSAPLLAVVLERLVITPLGDGPGWRQQVHDGSRGVLPGGDEVRAFVQVFDPAGQQFEIVEPYLASGVVSYRDASGRAWRRWGNTEPQRILHASDTKRVPPDQGHKIIQVER